MIDWKVSWRLKALALAGELSGSPRGEGMLRGELCAHAEAQTCTGAWAEQRLANPKTGLCDSRGYTCSSQSSVHVLTLLTYAAHINHMHQGSFSGP